MSKAFDKVSHVKLLDRLREFRFGGSINQMVWFILDKSISTNDCSWSKVEAGSSNISSATGVNLRSITIPSV